MKTKILRWLNQGVKKLGLQQWDIQVNWDYEEEDAVMSVICLAHYLRATINVNLALCSQSTNQEIKEACYHELIHILLWEFSELALKRFTTHEQLVKSEEKVTSVLAKVLS